MRPARKSGSPSPARAGRRILVLVIGGTALALGVALLVLPGPGIVFIVSGLGILALEFAWAKRWLRRASDLLKNRKSRQEDSQTNSLCRK